MRPFDVVLFGATGFTGRLVAEYLVKATGGKGLALAGRNREKLGALARDLGTDVPLLQADSDSEESLAAIASEAKVVCSTVGPYAKYGSKLVAACARAGTDYCDLTGEFTWMRRMIDAHHDEARRTGARLVHACGFDSVPSDLGTRVLQEHARAAHGAPCEDVTFAVMKMRGGASGGTVASMLGIVEEAMADPWTRKLLRDAYALNPEGERKGPDSGDVAGPAWDAELGRWTAPFVMGAINERVVRRTNALSGYSYGRNFRYHEVMAFPKGPAGFAAAVGTTAGLGALFAASAIPPVRALLTRTVLPAPGEGPSAEARERGFFDITIAGRGTDAKGRPFSARARVAAKGDPGYAATSRMLGESALCLAHDPPSTDGGVLTPAIAMGDQLVKRLRAVGMTFDAETTGSAG